MSLSLRYEGPWEAYKWKSGGRLRHKNKQGKTITLNITEGTVKDLEKMYKLMLDYIALEPKYQALFPDSRGEKKIRLLNFRDFTRSSELDSIQGLYVSLINRQIDNPQIRMLADYDFIDKNTACYVPSSEVNEDIGEFYIYDMQPGNKFLLIFFRKQEQARISSNFP